MAAPGGSMNDLQELIEIVRASRERTNGVFPLPDGDSCIDYAIKEAGGVPGRAPAFASHRGQAQTSSFARASVQ